LTLSANTASPSSANRLAPLGLFASDFSADVKRPKDVVQVSLATAGSTTQTNPTAFNDIGGTTLGASAVTLAHLYQPFGLSYADLQNGIKLERLVKVNMDKLADAIWAAATVDHCRQFRRRHRDRRRLGRHPGLRSA